MRCAMRMIRCGLMVFALGVGLIGAYSRPEPTSPRADAAARAVYLVGQLSDEDLLSFTSAVAAAEPNATVLLHTPAVAPHLKRFLEQYRPDCVTPVGAFADVANLERRLGIKLAPALEWKAGQPDQLWDALFPRAERVVVSPAQPRSLLLHAACLAGTARAPLIVVQGQDEEAAGLRRRLAAWKSEEVFVIGEVAKLLSNLKDVKLVRLTDESAVSAAYLERQSARGAIDTLVVTNSADAQEGAGLSRLAPWLALQRRAALLQTNAAGDNAAAVVRAALKEPRLRHADALVLLGDLTAIPMERRPNPAAGKDTEITMEPLTPQGDELFTLATGRLFHKDPGVVLLTLARQRLLAQADGPRKALIASNPGGGLPLMEVFSRHTSRELPNCGYQTIARFEGDVEKEELRRLLPEQDIFLWEGHYRTMVDEYGVPTWTEPLRPSLVFLQSCLALNEEEALPLLQRGAVAVIGSPSRTYSGTGGAFTLAFFDAMLYDGQSLGGALRQAKNFLLAYSQLKLKRLGDNAKLGGANLRSAWAFTLWGDPTLKLPKPKPPADELPAVRHKVRGTTITFSLPKEKYERVTKSRFTAQSWPNSRLAGLLTESGEEDTRRMVPFLLAEVHLPPPVPGQTPRLHSKLRDKNWVFLWDARRQTGYLLVIPPSQERATLRFDIQWEG